MGGAECRFGLGLSEEDVLNRTRSSALISVDLTASPVSVASTFYYLHYFHIELNSPCLSISTKVPANPNSHSALHTSQQHVTITIIIPPILTLAFINRL